MSVKVKKIISKLLKKFGFQISRSNGIPASYKLLNNYRYFQDKFNRIKHLDGDVVECGVGFGHTLLLLLHQTYVEGRKRTLWAFDSFEGFPEPSPEDKSDRNPKKGEWKVITQADLDDIFFRRCGMPSEARKLLKITKGYFNDTLPTSPVEKIALLHLDVDLYDSYKVCLDNLWGKVQVGGIVLFDEYKQKDTQKVFPGAARAIDEFFSDKKQNIQYDAEFDKYYLVKL